MWELGTEMKCVELPIFTYGNVHVCYQLITHINEEVLIIT